MVLHRTDTAVHVCRDAGGKPVVVVLGVVERTPFDRQEAPVYPFKAVGDDNAVDGHPWIVPGDVRGCGQCRRQETDASCQRQFSSLPVRSSR